MRRLVDSLTYQVQLIHCADGSRGDVWATTNCPGGAATAAGHVLQRLRRQVHRSALRPLHPGAHAGAQLG